MMQNIYASSNGKTSSGDLKKIRKNHILQKKLDIQNLTTQHGWMPIFGILI